MKILIIDGNNTMHRAFHSYSRLQNHGKPVSIIYGMPILVNALVNQFKPDDVYICWDGRKSPHRMRLLPTYKAGRKTFTEKDKAAFDKQRETVKKLFYFLNPIPHRKSLRQTILMPALLPTLNTIFVNYFFPKRRRH